MADTTFTDFLKAHAAELRRGDFPPASRAAWDQRRARLQSAIFAAAGPVPATPCDLKPQVLGALDRDGYRIEKLIFQSRPDVWVTANAYVPAGSGKCPAVLAVHGHHAWARIDPDVQAYCLGLCKLGFFVLCVDAFGAGERHRRPARGTYHGATDGAALWPAGQTLLGMQVYDNRRAVDYLLTRPEVDPARIGVTGASGGGNQTMYAGALDPRLACVVPVCSVGNYQAYFHVPCCVCEVLPGALQFTEEGDVLGLVAPRPLLVISAEKDSFQFSPAEAAKSAARAKQIYELSGDLARLRHVTVPGGHGYSKPMREAMYGWMSRWLKSEGQGEPIPDPPFETEDPEAIRCFPDTARRPMPWMTPTSFAKRTGEALLKQNFRAPPDHAEEWDATAIFMREKLQKVLGPTPDVPADATLEGGEVSQGRFAGRAQLRPEKGVAINVTFAAPANAADPLPAAIVVHLDGAKSGRDHAITKALASAGWVTAHPELRGTGAQQPERDQVREAVDHNTAEQAVWLGRPLLGQWAFDVQVTLEALLRRPDVDRRRLVFVGIGGAGLVALAAAARAEHRVAGSVLLDVPTTLLSDDPFGSKVRMGLLAPGLLTVGDMPHLAAMMAPRRLAIVGGIMPQGTTATGAELAAAFAFTTAVYAAHKAAVKLTVTTELAASAIVKSIWS